MSGLDPQEFDLTDLRRAWYSRNVIKNVAYRRPRKGHRAEVVCTFMHMNARTNCLIRKLRAGQRGVSNGGLPNVDLSVPSCHFCPFLEICNDLLDFPDSSGIFPFCPFTVYWPTNRTALSGGMDWWRMEWPHFQSPKNILQRLKFPGKPLKFRRKSDYLQVSGSEIWKFRAPKKMQFHTPASPYPHWTPSLIKRSYKEHSQKGPGHNQDLSRKETRTPYFGELPGARSLKKGESPKILNVYCCHYLCLIPFSMPQPLKQDLLGVSQWSWDDIECPNFQMPFRHRLLSHCLLLVWPECLPFVSLVTVDKYFKNFSEGKQENCWIAPLSCKTNTRSIRL